MGSAGGSEQSQLRPPRVAPGMGWFSTLLALWQESGSDSVAVTICPAENLRIRRGQWITAMSITLHRIEYDFQTGP